jgi:hypothetical protein
MLKYLLFLLPFTASAQFGRTFNTGVIKAGSILPARQNLIWDNSFAGVVATTTGYFGSPGMPTVGWNTGTGQYLSGYDNRQSCCSYSVGKDSTFPDTQPYALRLELRNSDPTVSGSQRTEITNGTNYAEITTGERWYGRSFRLSSWATDVCCESIWQWHDVGSSPDLCPPLSIQVDGGGNIILVRAIACNTLTTNIGTLSSWNDRWVDVVLHVVWDLGTSGVIECWVDGVKKATITGVKTQSNGGSYEKHGLNKFGGFTNVTTRVFEIANIRVGNSSATYADVAP